MGTLLDPLEELRRGFSWNSVMYKAWPVGVIDLIENHLVTICTVALIGVALSLGLVYFYRNIKTKVETVTAQMMGPSRPRFRKRDKMLFYGRKMLRKVNFLSNQSTTGRTRLKKRQMVLKFAKKLLRLKKEQPLMLQVKEPSQAFLEEDITEQMEQRLPSEVIYMLRSIRVFGFFEKPLFLELWKHIETKFIPAGAMLFSVGEPDDSIYVVQTGRIHVYITEPDGSELTFKEVKAGENIASLLSALVVLTGVQSVFKTVAARALEDSTVLRLRYETFKYLLEKYPESMVRVCQIVMIRLHRVTFTALHNYLGLTTQLIRSANLSKKTSTVSPKLSPSRASSRKTSQASKERDYPPFTSELPLPEKDIVSVDQSGSISLGETPAGIGVDTAQKDTSDILKPFMDTVPPLPNQHSEMGKQLFSESGKIAPDSSKARKRRASFVVGEDKLQVSQEPEDFLQLAVIGFMSTLGIQNADLIKNKVSVKEYCPGEYLAKQDSPENSDLFYVLTGCLIVSQKSASKGEEDTLWLSHPGELVGALAVLTGEPSLFTIRTRITSKVGIINSKFCYEILRHHPSAVLNLARTVIERLSPFVRQIDFALEWLYIESGRALYRQEDISDSTYIMLSGRLRSVLTRSDGKKEMVGEYGRGDLVGLVEVLTNTKRATTVMAVRDTELAKLPEGLLNVIKIKYPVVVTRLIHLLGHRILGSLHRGDAVSATTMISRPSGSNFTTVAILAVNEDVPLSAFSLELCHALRSIGPVFRLTSDYIRKNLGPSALDNSNEYRLCSWLGQQEDRNKALLYQCDSQMTSWTQRCIRQADCILIVALSDQEPTVGQLEQQAESIAQRTQKELVLLHKENAEKPRDTVKWLNMRSWCSSHHHIRCPKRMFAKKSPSKLIEIYNKLEEGNVNVHSDFARLARFLTGTSIGLVLGGGGARGCSHVGMIRAIQEAGIPVDLVGGVSIGALMGALWCQEMNVTTFVQKAREWSSKMTSLWRQLWDLTYPITAWFTGAAFNRTVYDLFGDRQIEDLWLPYFTVTTDITSSCMRIHTHGSLWRYIRSSMSLSGYMPPLCDPIDGHLLLDGGYVNNLPADIMREMGAETIIAVDVGSQDETDLTNYGDSLSGWWLLWKRWNPWASPVKVPSQPEIQSRLAYVSCVRQLEQVKNSDYCTYVRPPIDKYKTLQFGSFNEIMEVGYIHGKTLFTGMKAGQQSLRSLLNLDQHHIFPDGKPKPTTFTDLAEMVCTIKTPMKNTLNYVSEDDECSDHEKGYISDQYVVDTDKEEEEETGE